MKNEETLREEKQTILLPRAYGKRTIIDEGLLKDIHEAKKYIVFHYLKGIVHIIPDEKLKEMFAQREAEIVKAVEGLKGKFSSANQIVDEKTATLINDISEKVLNDFLALITKK